ncbi:MAG: DHH family phosphoesterase [Chitinophagaceae bacterium]|nr:DHH family phosphoesterase [Chitinophagaceae bacterium]
MRQPARVVVTMHQKPDADAMGSSLALAHFLRKLGHSVTVISPTNWAKWLDWMPGSKEVLDYESMRAKADEILDNTDVLFCLDFNVFLRTRYMADKLRQIQCTKVLIDHHQEPDAASFNFWCK